MRNTRIRIILVDDHVINRQALASLLATIPDLVVLSSTGTNGQAPDTIRSLNPDIILFNQTETDYESILATITIHINFPAIPMLILTRIGKDQGIPKSLTRLMVIGLDRLLPRETSVDELVQAIRNHVAGTLDEPQNRDQKAWAKPPSLPLECYLTPREQEILQYMASPDTYRDIAHHLSLSEETVRSHAKNIMAKLQQSSRFLAVLEAVRYGFIDLHTTHSIHHEHHQQNREHDKRLSPRCTLNERGSPMCAVTGQLVGPCPIRQSLAKTK